jgi:hypothetical protein
MWLRAGLVALSLLFANLLAGDAWAQRDRDRDRDRGFGRDWELLGTQTVGFNVDRDVVQVGRREGRFTRIALEVQENDIFLLDLKVVFMNGQVQDIPVRSLIRRGSRTAPLDLRGGERFIRQVEMTYRARPNFRGRAVVKVYGEQDRDVAGPGPGPGPGPGIGRWEELGCQRVGFLVDRDVIRVGRQEGRFRAIRLRVEGNRVHVLDLKVVYANGQPDDIPVRAEIRAGGMTRPLDLRGERRAIRQIELLYRSQPSFRGQARLCVDGQQ